MVVLLQKFEHNLADVMPHVLGGAYRLLLGTCLLLIKRGGGV